MAISTRTVTGTILDGSGTPVAGGHIIIYPDRPFTTDDGGTGQRIAAPFTESISSSGVVSFEITQNSLGTPSDTVYIAEHHIRGRAPFTEYWSIAGSGALNYADITRVSVPDGFVASIIWVAKYTALPTADASWDGKLIYYQPTSADRGELLACGDAGSGVYEWRAFA